MPRTKGSKNRPKTNITKDYATQIAEKQETIASLNTEIASITANIDTLKADLKKTALKKAEKEVATLEAKKAKADANAAGVRTVFFEDCRIVYNENKRRTKFKEMEREKNELIQNTSYCNHRI